MYVSSETILNKIEAHVAKAKNAGQDSATMLREVENIKLLCELLLLETRSLSPEERTMPSKEALSPKQSQASLEPLEETVIHDPKSIFDF